MAHIRADLFASRGLEESNKAAFEKHLPCFPECPLLESKRRQTVILFHVVLPSRDQCRVIKTLLSLLEWWPASAAQILCYKHRELYYRYRDV